MILAHVAQFIALLVMLLPLTAGAASNNERRIALVVGIGSYQNAPHRHRMRTTPDWRPWCGRMYGAVVTPRKSKLF
jgi:hypothetical protein